MIFHLSKTGTGKTRTLVAAIAEIVQTTNEFILVTAHSNAACDEIASRLLDVLEDGQLYRLFAKSFDKNQVPPKLESVCNKGCNNDFQFPSWEFLCQYRVVVATLITTGALVRSRGEDPNFSSSHFSRLFIDEAACVHEPAALIPIAGEF